MEPQAVRTLIVEDSSTYALLIKEYLSQARSHRFEIVHQETLAGAVERAKMERFDIVLLDLGLPDSFGLATLTSFHEAAPGLPTIVLSANTDDEVSFGGASAGAQDYLVKGTFDDTALVRAIHYAIERKKIERFKDEFGSIVSHELRAPLAVVKGAVDAARDPAFGPLNERQRTFLDLASKHLQRLSRIIAGILDLARYESGRAEPANVPVVLDELVHELFAAVRPEAEKKGLVLDAAIARDIGPFHTDPDMLFEVFYNLLTNALRFARTRIVLGARRLPEGSGGAGFIEFCVGDDGSGIPPERAEKVFDKFFHVARRARGKGYTGTGLGLSICKTIVGLLGGTIRAGKSDLGGAGFFFTVADRNPKKTAG